MGEANSRWDEFYWSILGWLEALLLAETFNYQPTDTVSLIPIEERKFQKMGVTEDSFLCFIIQRREEFWCLRDTIGSICGLRLCELRESWVFSFISQRQTTKRLRFLYPGSSLEREFPSRGKFIIHLLTRWLTESRVNLNVNRTHEWP